MFPSQSAKYRPFYELQLLLTLLKKLKYLSRVNEIIVPPFYIQISYRKCKINANSKVTTVRLFWIIVQQPYSESGLAFSDRRLQTERERERRKQPILHSQCIQNGCTMVEITQAYGQGDHRTTGGDLQGTGVHQYVPRDWATSAADTDHSY